MERTPWLERPAGRAMRMVAWVIFGLMCLVVAYCTVAAILVMVGVWGGE